MLTSYRLFLHSVRLACNLLSPPLRLFSIISLSYLYHVYIVSLSSYPYHISSIIPAHLSPILSSSLCPRSPPR